MGWLRRHEAPVAAALILIAVLTGWLLMPRLMLLASPAGPLAGLLIALVFMLALFGVLWLRSRWQRSRMGD
jgi:hypothetical protein